MELKFKTCPIGEIKTVLDTTVDNPFDFDVTLPDYFPDIQRVLKCIVTPGITSSSISSNRAIAEGNALLRIIYSAENKRIYCYEQTFSFSKSVDEKPLTSDMSLMATVKTDYVNCRATGQRRLNIQGVISMRFTVKVRTERTVICGCDDSSLQLKRSSTEALSTVNTAVKSFILSEVTQLQEGLEPIDKLFNCSSYIITDSIKAVSGKILVKGDLVTDVTYSTENDPLTGVLFRHTMPISQIIDVNGVTDDSINNVVLRVADLTVLPKNDANGSKNQLEITVRADACITADEKNEFLIITDAYSTDGELSCNFENVVFKNIIDRISDSLTLSDTLELGSDGISSLTAIWCNGVRQTNKIKGDDLIVNGSVSLVMIYVNKEGEPSYVEKEIVFEHMKHLSSKVDNVQIEPLVQVSACKGTVSSDNAVNVKLEILIKGAIYSYSERKIVSGAELEDNGTSGLGSSLVIYFAEEGEEIWNIARKYKTTVDLIKNENELNEDVIVDRKMILIPSC